MTRKNSAFGFNLSNIGQWKKLNMDNFLIGFSKCTDDRHIMNFMTSYFEKIVKSPPKIFCIKQKEIMKSQYTLCKFL